MSRHDSQPPMDDWVGESRPCPCFERPERVTRCENTLSIPPNIELGGRGD